MASSSATQEFVPVRDIKEGVVILKNGQLCKVLLASSINFALKSRDEQQAILFQFQNFLNTLDFSLQIYVQSRRLNIEPYITTLQGLEDAQYSDLMRVQLREYIEFIKTFTTEVDVMSKNFFVIVPYTPVKLNLGKSLTSIMSQGKSVETNTFEEQRLQLEQRQAVVVQGLARIGVKTISLRDEELVELFYHIYNPSDITGQAPSIQ